jgi:hypothetical protein
MHKFTSLGLKEKGQDRLSFLQKCFRELHADEMTPQQLLLLVRVVLEGSEKDGRWVVPAPGYKGEPVDPI